MTLQEAESKLSKINAEINALLQERESILKEWNAAFDTENPEKIICIDENAGSAHNLYLVNGESRMHVCVFDDHDLKGSIDDFYRRIDTSMCIFSIANKRNDEIPDYQKNLIYAKAAEIRESMQIDKPVRSD